MFGQAGASPPRPVSGAFGGGHHRGNGEGGRSLCGLGFLIPRHLDGLTLEVEVAWKDNWPTKTPRPHRVIAPA